MKDFVDYLVKNKYVIICVSIVVILYAVGLVELLSKLIIFLVLIIGAVFVGKKLQDNEGNIKNIFDLKKFTQYKDVYYYQERDENKNNKE